MMEEVFVARNIYHWVRAIGDIQVSTGKVSQATVEMINFLCDGVGVWSKNAFEQNEFSIGVQSKSNGNGMTCIL